MIPNVTTIRPANPLETSHAWLYAMESKTTPTALMLSRQDLVVKNTCTYEEFKQGAYVAAKEDNKIDYTIIATGSEVNLALEVKELLKARNIDVRVVSMPSTNLFDKLTKKAQKEIIGVAKSKVIALEMGSTALWYKYADTVFGIDSFGASGKMVDVIKKFGFTAENIASKIK